MKLIFLIPFLLFGTMSFAQNNFQKLDSLFNSLYSYRQFNGNVLVAENGLPIYQKSFGFADFETKKLNNDSSSFTIGSISKVFTSIAILQLKEKGKLKLDDPVVKYFRDFPYSDITIKNLLSHTSGLPDYELYDEQIKNNPNKIFTNKDVLPSLKMWKEPLKHKPYEKWSYSNTNFCLLALLIEKLSGLGFQEYIQKNIFKPAKMNNTYFQSEAILKKDLNKTINYDYPNMYSSKLQNVDSLKKYRWRLFSCSGFIGQGNIITTSDDMLKFDKILYLGNLLKSSTLEEAFTPTKIKSGNNTVADIGIGKASYGLGWFIFEDTSNGKTVWHTGGQPGCVSIYLRNITKKQTVIMFDNAFHINVYGDGVNAMSILNNKPIITRKKSLIQDYGSILAGKGIDEAFCKLQELKSDSLHYYLSEDDMNELGLRLLYEASFSGHNELSLEVLKLNTIFFPNSSNTYDSYGEALAKVGKKDEAIFMYRKSIELNPENKGGKKILEELLKK